MFSVSTFFMNTWEEYYRGELVLPIINGPNEGILIAIAIYFTTAATGSRWWADNSVTLSDGALPTFLGRDRVEQVIGSIFQFLGIPSRFEKQLLGNIYTGKEIVIQYNTLAVWFIVVAGMVTCVTHMIQVRRAVNKSPDGHGKYGSGWLLKHYPFVHALTRLLPLAVITLIANVWFFVSPEHIFVRHPRIFCWTTGLLFTKLSIHLMIAHLCSVEFHPFRRTLVPFLFYAFHILFSFLNHGELPAVDEDVLLMEFFLLSSVTFGHLVVNAVAEISTILDVSVFSIPQEKQEALRAASKKSN
jgi:ethanolaminephosphotransferase